MSIQCKYMYMLNHTLPKMLIETKFMIIIITHHHKYIRYIYIFNLTICNGWSLSVLLLALCYLFSSFGRVLGFKSRGPRFNSRLGRIVYFHISTLSHYKSNIVTHRHKYIRYIYLQPNNLTLNALPNDISWTVV